MTKGIPRGTFFRITDRAGNRIDFQEFETMSDAIKACPPGHWVEKVHKHAVMASGDKLLTVGMRDCNGRFWT
jgi:hypothetical protein